MTKERDGRDRPLRVLKETVLLLVLAVALALGVKTFFLQSFYIPSESMLPGLEINDRIVVQKPSYWFGEPQRGDVIVFDDPGGWLSGVEGNEPQSLVAKGLSKIGLYPTGGHLVKRVIGVEGDVVQCCDSEGRLMVNGQPLDEDAFIEPQECDGPMIGECRWKTPPVPPNSLFVMGDNRDDSADSSVHLCRAERGCDPSDGFVPVDLVVGKVFAVAWPMDRMTLVGRPEVFEAVPDPATAAD